MPTPRPGDTITDFSKLDGDKIDLRGLGLTEDDLVQLFANSFASPNQDQVLTYVFALGGDTSGSLGSNAYTVTGMNIDGGGTLVVGMDRAFDELDLDDFII